MRRFIPHLVNWLVVFMEKKRVGLGIRCFDVLNKALINKWTWSFTMEREAIWKRVIVGKLGKK